MKRFFEKNIAKFVFLILVYLGLTFLSQLPYIGLFIDTKVILVIVWLISVIIFRLQAVSTAKFGAFCLIIAVLLFQLGSHSNAMAVGEVTYLLFILSISQELFSYSRKK